MGRGAGWGGGKATEWKEAAGWKKAVARKGWGKGATRGALGGGLLQSGVEFRKPDGVKKEGFGDLSLRIKCKE